MNCTRCGAELSEGAKFCASCGAAADLAPGSVTVGGSISGTGIAVGAGAHATGTQGIGGDELVKLFASVYECIEARPADPNIDKDEITQTVRKVNAEVAKGEAANPSKVERWLRTLADVAPDILEATAAVLVNPVTGAAATIRKIAAAMRERHAPT